MTIINILIIIFCIFLIFILLRKFKRDIQIYEKQRKEFVLYLKKINDFETLKKIGEINLFDKYERWYPNFYSMKYYLTKKVDKDIQFSTFLNSLIIFKKKYVQRLMPIFLLTATIDIVLSNLIKNPTVAFIVMSATIFSLFIYLAIFFKKYEWK